MLPGYQGTQGIQGTNRPNGCRPSHGRAPPGSRCTTGSRNSFISQQHRRNWRPWPTRHQCYWRPRCPQGHQDHAAPRVTVGSISGLTGTRKPQNPGASATGAQWPSTSQNNVNNKVTCRRYRNNADIRAKIWNWQKLVLNKDYPGSQVSWARKSQVLVLEHSNTKAVQVLEHKATMYKWFSKHRRSYHTTPGTQVANTFYIVIWR